MSILKYFYRVERMHRLIKASATGSCDEFAAKMGLSKRQLLENVSELREMGAPIKFSVIKNSYSKLEETDLQKIIGGNSRGCDTTALRFGIIELSVYNSCGFTRIADAEKLLE
jgi:biotin operon repressor